MFPSRLVLLASARGPSSLILRKATSTTFAHSFRMSGATNALKASAAATSPMLCQRRTQYAHSGKREHEAFLTQFDPLDVLGLPPDCTIEEIDAAFEAKKGYYGANGKNPDPKMVDRVFRAHEILKDPESPYYLKAHSSQVDRQRLQFQLLPKSKRRMIQFQVGILMCLALSIFFGVIMICFRPIEKSKRAALR